MKSMRNIFSLLLLALLLGSCVPKNIVYFQDRNDGTFEAGRYSEHFKLQPEDQISIYVKSRNTELAKIFNMGESGAVDYGTNNSNNIMSTSSGQNNYAAYTIDSLGYIDFPIIGKLHVAGLDRKEVGRLVADTLRNSGQLEDAVATVQYVNLYVNILGEMGSKRQRITEDKYNIIDLLTENDLNFTGGKRKNIMLMRDSCGIKKAYTIDVTSIRKMYDSPVYYVHPGDLVYAEPRNMKVRSTTANGNFWMNYGFWLGVPSIILSLVALIKK